ncbi:MAG TPA: hypothetical protein PL009_04460 [Flavipsychrobacter sp.]|nr:hypothetical protein [Flavipsychrobacter sp.]
MTFSIITISFNNLEDVIITSKSVGSIFSIFEHNAGYMTALELKFYEIFKNRFSEKEAETFIKFLEEKIERKYEEIKDVLLTKEDKIDLLSKIEGTKTDMLNWFFAFFITLALMILGLYLKN